MAATHPGDGSRAHRPYLESRRTPFVSRPSSQGLESVSRLRGTAPKKPPLQKPSLSPVSGGGNGKRSFRVPWSLWQPRLLCGETLQIGSPINFPGGGLEQLRYKVDLLWDFVWRQSLLQRGMESHGECLCS